VRSSRTRLRCGPRRQPRDGQGCGLRGWVSSHQFLWDRRFSAGSFSDLKRWWRGTASASAWGAAPGATSFGECERGDSQCDERIEPPDAQERVGEQADEHGDSQVATDEVLSSFSGGCGGAQLFAEAQLRSPQPRADAKGRDREVDAQPGCLGPVSDEQRVGRPRRRCTEPAGRSSARPAVEPSTRSSSRASTNLKAPHDDHAREALDGATEPVPNQGSRAGEQPRRRGGCPFETEPDEREAGKPPGTPCRG
jgi:hypothetical protein